MIPRPSFLSLTSASLVSAVISLLLMNPATKGVAHVGHGNEFQGGNQVQSAGTVKIDPETVRRLGLKVEPLTRQRLAFGLLVTGQIEPLPNQQVEITTPVGGTVLRLLVNPGELVRAGQPVAIMTSPELAELRTTAFDRKAEAIAAVQQAQADVRLAQENLQQQHRIVAAEIQEVRSELSFAQERYDKDRELLANGAIARRTFLESETALAQARSSLAKTESRLPISQAQAQLKRAQSALDVAQSRVNLSTQTYQTRLRQLGTRPNPDGTLTIVTPIAGVVADRETTPGESGQDAGKKVMTIVDNRTVQVSGNIFEQDLERVQVGQPVRVKANGVPHRAFKGEINVVGAVVNAESRIIPIKAKLENPNGLLKPGMFVALEVLTNQTPVPVLTIPITAVVETHEKRQIVFVQNGNAFEATAVTLGRRTEDLVEVTSGLFDGDRVVTQRASQLYAQSLRGGTNVDDHSEAPAPSPFALPWGVMIPVSGAIVAGTFWAGMVWANRRSRRLAMNPVINGHNPVGYGQELYANPTSQSEPAHLTNPPEE